MAITRHAKVNFEQRDWWQRKLDSQVRLSIYQEVVDDTEQRVRALLGDQVEDRTLWAAMKSVYRQRIAQRPDRDLAETYFNSISRRVFATVGVEPLVEFVGEDPPGRKHKTLMVRWSTEEGTAEAIAAALESLAFAAPWDDLFRDAERVAQPGVRGRFLVFRGP